MKNRFSYLGTALALCAAPLLASPDRITVPLSEPSKPAAIEASLVMGSIRVVAGKAGEVVIEARASEDDCDDCDHGHNADEIGAQTAWAVTGKPKNKGDKSRMRRIPSDSFELAAEENDNRVEIDTESWARAVDLRIEVPPGSSLTLSTVNDGEIEVTGVNGELDLHNTNGDIRVRDVKGPVNANTVNGDVEVVFTKDAAKSAMAFATLNGDVDLTLPADANFDVRLRSDNGEIYSDFDFTLAPQAARVEADSTKGRYRVSIAKELAGKIGAGGPELFLKTFNGDLLLRKAD